MPRPELLLCAAAGAGLLTLGASGRPAPGRCIQEQPGAPTAGPTPTASPTQPDEPRADPLADEPTQVRVHLRTGGQVTGELIDQSEKGVVLRIGGITTAVNFTDINRVETLPSLLQRYQEMKAAIPNGDADQLAMLVQWLITVDRLEWAQNEVRELLERDPNHPEGVRLQRVITSQLELRQRAGSRPGGAAPPRPPPSRRDFPLLTEEEVNLIRVYETDLDHPPRMLVSRKTVEDLMAAYAGDPLIPATREGREALLRKKPAQILDLMFRLRARDFYGRVEVLDAPAPLRLFRDEVHQTWLINSCATDKCHGGEEAGRLWLATRRPNAEATVFTNFLILERFRTSKGDPLIDYGQPERSPLLQMGLPREDSVYPHPPVPGPLGRGDEFRPVFRSSEDRRFRQALEWIRGMYTPRPDYPIAYVPPTPGAAPAGGAPVSNGENPGR